MADKTKYSIKVAFEKKVPVSHVASSKLQKEKDGQATKKTLGVTKPRASFEPPVLHWDETTDPINKTVKLALKEVTATVTFSARIWIDKAIDKSCDCYAHVFDHEKRHAIIWSKESKKAEAGINKAVAQAKVPTMSKPVEVKAAQAAKIRSEAFKAVDAALGAAVQKAGIEVGKASRKIHTPAELKKTNKLCAVYLTG